MNVRSAFVPGLRTRSQSKLGCDTPSTKPNGSTPPMSEVGNTSIAASALRSAAARASLTKAAMRSGRGEQHQEDMRLALADAPTPVHRRVRANVAETLRPVGAARHALDELRREALNDRVVHAERPQARGGDRDLRRFGDRASRPARRKVREAGRLEPAEPASRRRRVADPQEEVARAGQRAEGGPGDGLNVGSVDVGACHAAAPVRSRRASVESRRRSSSPSRSRCGCECCARGRAPSGRDRPCTRHRSESGDGAESA